MNVKIIAAIVAVAVVAVVGVAVVTTMDNGEHNVTYYGNGGLTLKGEETYESSDKVALPNFFVMEGKSQYNWNTKADGTGTYVAFDEKIPSNVDELYAQFAPVLKLKNGPNATEHGDKVRLTIKSTVGGDDLSTDIGALNDFASKVCFIGSESYAVFTASDDCTFVGYKEGMFLFMFGDEFCAYMFDEGITLGEVSYEGDKVIKAKFTIDRTVDVDIVNAAPAYHATYTPVDELTCWIVNDIIEADLSDSPEVTMYGEQCMIMVTGAVDEEYHVHGSVTEVTDSYVVYNDGVNDTTIYYRISGVEGPLKGATDDTFGPCAATFLVPFATHDNHDFDLVTPITVEFSKTPFA